MNIYGEQMSALGDIAFKKKLAKVRSGMATNFHKKNFKNTSNKKVKG